MNMSGLLRSSSDGRVVTSLESRIASPTSQSVTLKLPEPGLVKRRLSGIAHLRAAALGTTALIGGFMLLASVPAAQAACTVTGDREVDQLETGDAVVCTGTGLTRSIGGGPDYPNFVTITIGDGTTPTSLESDNSNAVFIHSLSSVAIRAGAVVSVSTESSKSKVKGIIVEGDSNIVTINGGTLDANGVTGSRGINVLGSSNTVDLQSGSIGASGAEATAIDMGEGSGHNTVTISGGTIVANGVDSYGIRFSNGNNVFTMSGGSISAAVQAIVLTGGSNDAATISGGDISTTGSDNAVEVTGDGSRLTISGGSITTMGDGANAVVADALEMSGGSIRTHGSESIGIASYEDANFILSGGSIETSGDGSTGVEGRSSSGTVTMSGSSIKTTGIGASGIIANDVTINSGSVQTSGANSDGIRVVSDAARVSINGGSVSATGAGANAIRLSGRTGTGTLTIGSAASITGNIAGVRDTALGSDAVFQLTLNGTGAGVINGAISGFESITKNDSGSFKLNGVITGTDTININAGLLSLNTDFLGGINIASGARLGGSGTLGALTVSTGSTLAPGNSIGTLNVTSANFAAGSTFEVEVNGGGNIAGVHSDLLHASGAVTISNLAKVTVGPVNGTDDGSTYATSTLYTIVRSGTSVTGTFGSVTDSFAFLDSSLSYDARNVYMTLARNSVDFATVAATPNQAAAGGALQQLGAGTAYDAAVSLGAAQARSAFDQLSDESHASLKGGLISDSGLLRDAIGARIRSAFDAGNESGGDLPSLVEGMAYWSQGFGVLSDTDGNGNAAGFSQNTGGVLVGADAVSGDWMLGLMAGYSRSSASVDDRRSSADIDSYHAGFYGSREFGALRLRSGLSYSWNDIATSRSVTFGGFTDQLSSKYSARTLQAFGELGYGIDTTVASLEPFAALAHVNLSNDSFTESGGTAALTSGRDSSDVTFSTLGLRANRTVNLGGTGVTFKGMIGWQHAYGDTTPYSTMAFAGSNGFTVAGAPIAADAAVFEAGVDLKLSQAATLGISYTGQIASDANRHGFDAKLGIRF